MHDMSNLDEILQDIVRSMHRAWDMFGTRLDEWQKGITVCDNFNAK